MKIFSDEFIEAMIDGINNFIKSLNELSAVIYTMLNINCKTNIVHKMNIHNKQRSKSKWRK